MFRQYTEGAAIEIGDGKQKPKASVDQQIRMGQGKSRLNQLDPKAGGQKDTLMSAKEITQQLERINKELT